MKMPEVVESDPNNHREIYNALIQRCRQVRKFQVRAIVEESWTGQGPIQHSKIENGVYVFEVIAFTQREAMLKVVDNVPVLKFLDECDE
jgi:hypothetical protein